MSDKISNERLCGSYASWHFLLGGLHVGGGGGCFAMLVSTHTATLCVTVSSKMQNKTVVALKNKYKSLVMANGVSFNFDMLELD